ncbi:MAG: efflux RND transporter periplasmic adaptor subunit [Bryobacteraceae bacterium]
MPVPAAAPLTPVVGPQVVQSRPKKPNRRGRWFLVILLILAIGAGIYAWRAKTPARNAAALPSIRTASITSGPLEKTLRLTGVTAAANYVSLITPRLRGSRSDHNRDLSTASTTAAATGATSQSSSTSSATGTSSAPNASAAFTAATSRLGSASTSPAASTSASSAASPSTAMGPSGLGTTSDELPPTIGAGGASNDFLLVLQDVAPAGTMVRKGEQVAEFDRQYMLLRLDDYRASVFQSEAMLKSRKANLEISHNSHEQLVLAAKGSLDKARLDLKTIPVLSDIDADKARLAFQQAEAKYQQLLKEVPFVLASEHADTRNSELDLDEAKLELTRAEKNADQMLAKAPIDGLVVMQTTWRGGDFGQIQRGDQLWPGQFYMQVVDPRSMVIDATVNQVDVQNLRLGQKARIHFDAYPGLELPAHVDSIAAVTKPGMFRAQFVKEVAVRLKLDAMDNRVIPDLSVSAEIIEDADGNAPALAPIGSIFNDSKPHVFVQTGSGWQRRDVEIGLKNNLDAVVKGGIKPGEVVALDPPQVTP